MEADYGTVAFNAVDLHKYSRQAVYTEDGADLLYVKHVVGFMATYAPGGTPHLPSVTTAPGAGLPADTAARLNRTDTTSAILAGRPTGTDPTDRTPAGLITRVPVMEPPGGGVPEASQRSGPETDADLKDYLLTPRQKFVLWAFDRQTGQRVAWLESPRPGFTVDADNGPRPIACDVISVSGEPHSIGVYYEIETSQPPCPVGSDRFVLSHRWQMTHSHDADHYLTRIIQGVVVFHPGVRELIGIHPDRIRNQFLHPIPLGFRRSVPDVTQSSDGLTIRYTITDTDPTITFAPGDSGATQIDIQEKFQYVAPPLDPRGTVDRIGDAAARFLGIGT